ncbi:restriction endonuclease subunit S [Negativicoccus succinicivorans]|uniref:restriction endonuclease subunit S n=1 Tax=Negativicoccus succinicivorans TaxID=620903 RepID=UPI0028D3BE38|nr:restriction endonuclease subunit S [Negativicoccus succinicivorans]
MEQNKNIPQIRFEGFTDDWEQRKLGEIGSISMCRRIFKEQTSEVGDIPFYKIGTFGAEPDAFISRELFEEYKSKYPYPQKGDILISASGSIGRTVVFTGNNEYFQDSNIVWLKHDERLSNQFLKCFYSVVKWDGIEGSTIKRLYNDNILNTVICMPSVPEQGFIGGFFENLDHLITLHQQKYEKFLDLKKAMLHKLFPKEGETTPEIRFDGFSGEWGEVKFKDIAEVKRGLTYKPVDVCKAGVRVLRSSNVDDEFFVLRKDDVFVQNQVINIDYAKDGDILVTAANGSSNLVGKHAVIENINNQKVVHGGFMLLIRTKEPYFLNSYMSSYWYRKFIAQFVSGGNGAIGNLSQKSLEDYKVFVPEIEEQKAIGEYFSKLDQLIALNKEKLEKLKNIKSLLLDKMFV